MNLPIYEVIIDDNAEGLYAIALVENPATEVSWLAFSKEQDKTPQSFKCSVIDEEEKRVLAVVTRANFPFYRLIDGFEFYAMFSTETIKQMAQKFLKKGFQGNVNIEHTNTYVDGVEMVQIFLKDTAKGINPKGFEEIEDGSLFVEYKVENEEIWQAIKQGIFTSISLEGMFNIKPTDKVYNPYKEIDSVEDLENYLNELNK